MTLPRALHRRGMATATAITLLALVAVTIAAMGTLFAAEARRTRDAATHAQLRQLLIAAAVVAQQRLQTDDLSQGEVPIALPKALAADRASLSIQIHLAGDPNRARAQIQAALPTATADQTVQFVRQDHRWRITGALADGSDKSGETD